MIYHFWKKLNAADIKLYAAGIVVQLFCGIDFYKDKCFMVIKNNNYLYSNVIDSLLFYYVFQILTSLCMLLLFVKIPYKTFARHLFSVKKYFLCSTENGFILQGEEQKYIWVATGISKPIFTIFLQSLDHCLAKNIFFGYISYLWLYFLCWLYYGP